MTRALRRVWKRVQGLLLSRRAEVDLGDELETHIQLLADDNLRRGMSRDEAYRQARIKFGNVEVMKEQYRDQRSLPIVESTIQDLRFAIRLIRHNPGFSIVAILSLAIGIGANTAIFSLVNTVVLQPLPYANADRLFAVRELRTTNQVQVFPVNPAHAIEWARQCPSLEAVAVLRNSEAQIAAGTEPATLPGVRVTSNFLALLGVAPMLGRTFREDEEQAGRDRVVMLSESLWRSRFNADRSLLGRTVLVDGVDHEVIGIVPGSFWRSLAGGMQNAPSNRRFEMFRPLVVTAEERARMMGNFNYAALVRLKPGATREAALAEMDVVQGRFPAMTGAEGSLATQLIPLQNVVTGRPLALWTLAAAVGAVLLIVCVNLANLLLSRVAARSRETAVRSALGASRWRLFQQALLESLLLSLIGGAAGVLLAGGIVQFMVGGGTLDLPRLHELGIDARVLAFAVLATITTAFAFGVLPAWRLANHMPGEALRGSGRAITEGREGLRLRKALIGAEVGLSTALLIVAALLTISLSRLVNVDKGFDAEHVLIVDIDTAGPLYEDAEQRSRFLDRLLARVSALPGVDAVGVTTQLPLEGNTWNDPIYKDQGSERHPVDNRYASPDFFRAMGIPIVLGRAFDDTDRSRSVAVLSRKAADILWPGDPNPVGRMFFGEDDIPKLLVGISEEVRAALHQSSPPHAYYPYWQRPPGDVDMVIRSSSSPDQLARPLRTALHAEDATLPIAPIRPAQALVDGSVAQRRFQSILMLLFAASALLVAGLGIYGVVAYSVTRRLNEIGIRMALGARRSALLMLLVRQGMTPVVLGLASGIAAPLLLARPIRGLLFEVDPADPSIIGAVAAVLIAVAVAACLVPARRATTTNTLSNLRAE